MVLYVPVIIKTTYIFLFVCDCKRDGHMNGTIIGPLKGSESGAVGKANGSTGTGRKWKPHGVAFLYQVDPCRIKTKIIVRIKCIILLFIRGPIIVPLNISCMSDGNKTIFHGEIRC
jgi:hypothetical protein